MMFHPRLVAPLLILSFAFPALPAPARAQADSTSPNASAAVTSYLATVRKLTALRVRVDTAHYEGLLDTCAIERFTLSRWESPRGLAYRELMPVAKIPYTMVDSIWTRRAGVPGGIARGILAGSLAGLTLGMADPARTCPLDQCRPFQSAIAGLAVGVVAGGVVGGIVGATRRGWTIAYPSRHR